MFSMKKIIEKILSKLFLVICSVFSCYMTYLQLKYYLKNEDKASISYQIFNNQEKDQYPTFTICFGGAEGAIFENGFYTANLTNLTALSYQRYLSGELEDDIQEYADVNYDEMVQKIRQLLYSAKTRSLKKPNNMIEEDISFVPKLKQPGKICYTKATTYQNQIRQVNDSVDMKPWLENVTSLIVELHIHEKGKLLRSLNKHPVAKYDLKPMPVDKVAMLIFTGKDASNCKSFEINDVEILRKRENSNIPCNKSLSDEDVYIITMVIQKAKCIPSFWGEIAEKAGLRQLFPKCTMKDQYRRIAKQYDNFMNSLVTMDIDYVDTCTQMTMTV